MFKAIERKLGIGKKPGGGVSFSEENTAASDDKISKHKASREERDKWREDAARMVGIVAKLSDEYKTHKQDFALGRYETLKNMIKSAIQEYSVVLQENKNRALLGPRAGSGKAEQPPGRVGSLKQNAKDFAEQKAPSGSGTSQKSYSQMTCKEVDEEIRLFHKETLQYKQDFRDARDQLEKLTDQYEDSKQLGPTQRYNELKIMIKDITRPAAEGGTAS